MLSAAAGGKPPGPGHMEPVDYRIWTFTSRDDVGGNKGDVSLCLHGALGQVWVKLSELTPTAGSLFDRTQRCELHAKAEEVGSLFKLTVAYAHGGDEPASHKPWWLQQIVVRRASDGIVTTFPAATELKGPAALLELMPRLSWHEDRYGNASEVPPALPPSGQWHWPVLAVPPTGAGTEAAAEAEAEHEAAQLALYEAVCREEILPLVDGALHDVSMQRTPGTFLYECVQAATGGKLGGSVGQAAVDRLRRSNMVLETEVGQLKEAKASDARAGEAETERERDHVRRLREALEQKEEELREREREVSALRNAVSRAEKREKRPKSAGNPADPASQACTVS